MSMFLQIKMKVSLVFLVVAFLAMSAVVFGKSLSLLNGCVIAPNCHLIVWLVTLPHSLYLCCFDEF